MKLYKNMNLPENQSFSNYPRSIYKLYAITDRAWTGKDSLEAQAEKALRAGVTLLQLREKGLDPDAFYQEAVRIRELTKKYGVPLIINDNVEIALACGADGVHIGQEDGDIGQIRSRLGPGKILGVTAKNISQAIQAEALGADYLGSGAVFPSPTKKEAVGISLETLSSICRSVSIPVVAIGGITSENISRLSGSGAAGVAVVSGIFGQPCIESAVRTLLASLSDIFASSSTLPTLPAVLTIAGSDCSGGAGIQADLKTITAFGQYGLSALTAVTAQNTTGVKGSYPLSSELVAEQLDCIFTDIVPNSTKIGMVANKEIIETISHRLSFYHAENIVIDPIMLSTSKRRLLEEDAVLALAEKLFPLARLITPNLPEALCLSRLFFPKENSPIRSKDDLELLALRLARRFSTSVLLKGGHKNGDAADLLCCQGSAIWFPGERIDTSNTHGTGCTLSSAICCGLAAGLSMEESIRQAKAYLTGALKAGLNLGKGNGPLNHCWQLTRAR